MIKPVLGPKPCLTGMNGEQTVFWILFLHHDQEEENPQQSSTTP